MKKIKIILLLIFILGVTVRLFYFPQNVHFAFDQARDSFTALEILKGDFKIIGPPSFASDKLFPGPLIFYLTAPLYFLFDKNPESVSLFLRIFNSLGVFLVFLIGLTIFNQWVGISAAFFFAFSYEQSQYSLFISHQPLAVITVLLFYLGLSLLVFKKEQKGLILSLAGYGLSIQFHYTYLLLLPILVLILLIFRKQVFPFKARIVLTSLAVFLVTISSFILAEIKFNFRFISEILNRASFTLSGGGKANFHPKAVFLILNRFLHDTFLANYQLTRFVFLLMGIAVVYCFFRKTLRQKVLFLFLWLSGGLIPYLLSGTTSYYYSASASVSLLILVAYLIQQLFLKQRLLGILLILGILGNNLYQIMTINPGGPNSDIVIQPGMLLSKQKKVLDYIYLSANGEPFAVNALTVPLNVNTTWSYLFEWYGKQKYHSFPVWGGDAAAGYPGNLKVVRERSKLPKLRFVIVEPSVGINPFEKEKFFREENYFSKVSEEKIIGIFVIQKRLAI